MQNVLVPDRDLVRSRFSFASATYDSHAEHHRLIANEVVKIVSSLKTHSLLELGSGTGILSLELNSCFPQAYKVFTDIAPGMVDICRRKLPESKLIRHQVCDFEKAARLGRYSMVVSSCALQWTTDLKAVVNNQSSILREGGFAVHAIPVSGMLWELEDSFHRTGGTMNRLNYLTGTEWNRLFASFGFVDSGSFTRDFTVFYPSPADVLRATRSIGASLNNHPGWSSVSHISLRKALDHYRNKYGDETGAVPATYRVHFMVAKSISA